MATCKRCKVILHSETKPIHLEGLAGWIREENEDPPACPRCKSDKYVEWHEGEWLCSRCDLVVDR